MNNRDALEDEIAARKREDEANLTMLRFATAKHATPLLDAPGERDEIADRIVEATLPDAMMLLDFDDADRMRVILKGLAEEVLKMGLDASPDELVAWVEAEEAKIAAILAEDDRRE
jgi:hypothetical protein